MSGQEQWPRHTYFESVFLYCLNDLHKGDFGGESVSVVNDGISFISIPTVQLNASAAVIQSSEGADAVRKLWQ